MTEITVGAKCILFGEHAVVPKEYGFKKGIVGPLNILTRFDVEENSGSKIYSSAIGKCVSVDKPLEEYDDVWKPSIAAAQKTLEYLEGRGVRVRDFKLIIESELPMGCGLGTSAVISVGIVKALCDFHGVKIDNNSVFDIYLECEKIAHGAGGSGIDGACLVYPREGQLVEFHIDRSTGKAVAEPFDVGSNPRLVLAYSGAKASTADAIATVERLYDEKPDKVLRNMEVLEVMAMKGKEALSKGDMKLLGELMTAAHIHLDGLGICSEKMNRLVEAALEAGALGAKLTGSGPDGFMIALVDDNSEEVEDSLKGLAEYTISTELGM